MKSNEFNPNIGKNTFCQHQAELEQCLSQMAAVLSKDSQYSTISDFFSAFMGGFWDPYEELCDKLYQHQRPISEKIQAVEDKLIQALGPDSMPILNQYSDLICERNTQGLDLAYLTGFQCAIRFLIMGLFPAANVISKKEADR